MKQGQIDGLVAEAVKNVKADAFGAKATQLRGAGYVARDLMTAYSLFEESKLYTREVVTEAIRLLAERGWIQPPMDV